MKQFGAVWLKEMRQYFAAPIAFTLMAAFWAASGYLTAFNVYFVHTARMVTAFHNMSLLLLLIMPILTMRMFAEEQRAGTLEFLLALPLAEWQIVAGKYCAGLVILLIMLIGSATAVIPLALYGSPDYGAIVGGYVGIFLLGAAFMAIGLFVSSLSDNQIVAAVITWGVLLLLWFADYGAALDLGSGLSQTIRHLSFSLHYTDIIRGVIDRTTVIYFTSIIAGMVALAILRLKMRNP